MGSYKTEIGGFASYFLRQVVAVQPSASCHKHQAMLSHGLRSAVRSPGLNCHGRRSDFCGIYLHLHEILLVCRLSKT